MNAKHLLQQLLQSQTDSRSVQADNTPASNIADSLSSIISSKGSAALAGGALGLLIGSKSGRKVGGKVLTYGGLAVLGTLAYKAYQNYQQQSTSSTKNSMQPLDSLPAKDAETHCKVILVALIAASKADGHIDDRERKLIDGEVAKLTTDPELQKWFDAELKKELDPAEVAKHAKDMAMATEMYLASLLAVDQQNFMEKAYIDELGKQLNLAPDLQTELKLQVQKATAVS